MKRTPREQYIANAVASRQRGEQLDGTPDTRFGAVETVKPKPKKVLHYTAHRDPAFGGRVFYLLDGSGVGFSSLRDIRAVFPDRRLVRLPAKRNNRIFG